MYLLIWEASLAFLNLARSCVPRVKLRAGVSTFLFHKPRTIFLDGIERLINEQVGLGAQGRRRIKIPDELRSFVKFPSSVHDCDFRDDDDV